MEKRRSSRLVEKQEREEVRKRQKIEEPIPKEKGLALNLKDFSHGIQEFIKIRLARLKPRARKEAKNHLCKAAMALQNAVGNVKEKHLRIISRLETDELDNPNIVRAFLREYVDSKGKRIENRNVVFMHLWRDIIQFLPTDNPQTRKAAISFSKAFSDIIPYVRVPFTYTLTLFVG